MGIKTVLKWLLRSRSLQFVRDRFSRGSMNGTHIYNWKGLRLHYRPGTSDQAVIYEILLRSGTKADYWLPCDIRAKVILDIGANIGAASVYLSHKFPDARIYAFEPVPSNYLLLQRNVAPLANVIPINKALGSRNGTLEMFHSDSDSNLGGYSFHPVGSNQGKRINVEIRDAGAMMKELGLASADVIKIDTEGSEYEIITRMGRDFLADVQWIYGELHGNRDFELLAYLSDQFDIGAKRTMGKRLFMFQARNKKLRGRQNHDAQPPGR